MVRVSGHVDRSQGTAENDSEHRDRQLSCNWGGLMAVLHDESRRPCHGTECHTVHGTELLKDIHALLPLLDVNRLRDTSDLNVQRLGQSPIQCGPTVEIIIDTSLFDLALQTRHIVDRAHTAGHAVRALSGSQAKDQPLTQLLANTCCMPVVLPAISSAAVVLGTAMLDRFAHEAHEADGLNREKQSGVLWHIAEMTPSGTLVPPKAEEKEKIHFETKYEIFWESIDIHLRWRREMDDTM
ncbi:hypothetical protein OBBRIDRAFT_864743 [Obba rivulosa]|uniref:Carbohydrate kinase FGGY C-terminal domain-containing protein n=1 Tax=Obba rivulosa TaxID=1052685 RepID=A0A8E2DJ51_9APHY|nr:hypothetical protein OBBRIDRAFT_864743 [Obba rivulosa]